MLPSPLLELRALRWMDENSGNPSEGYQAILSGNSVVFTRNILFSDGNPAHFLAGKAQQFIPGELVTQNRANLRYIIGGRGGQHRLAQPLLLLHPREKSFQLVEGHGSRLLLR